MRFHFKFQKLLEIEKCREEGLVKELKILQKQFHDEEKLLGFLQSILTLQQSEMGKKLCTQSEAGVFVLFESYFSKLNRDIVVQSSKVKEVFKKMDHVREKLLIVFKKRKVLEKLRERYKKEYKEQVLRIENKHFDEVATSRFYERRYPLVIPGECNYETSGKQKNDDVAWHRNCCFWNFCHGYDFYERFKVFADRADDTSNISRCK
ncbi:MAG: flagellar export protein FliJ [Candidatus Brocadia sinica]|nr:flagellar export protein FliJ [Candidatus Brocadia sinica]